jgi:hypothetical protein
MNNEKTRKNKKRRIRKGTESPKVIGPFIKTDLNFQIRKKNLVQQLDRGIQHLCSQMMQRKTLDHLYH